MSAYDRWKLACPDEGETEEEIADREQAADDKADEMMDEW